MQYFRHRLEPIPVDLEISQAAFKALDTHDDGSGGIDPLNSMLDHASPLYSAVGSGVSVTSGIYTLPETGFWLVLYNFGYSYASSNTRQDAQLLLQASTNSGGAWDTEAGCTVSDQYTAGAGLYPEMGAQHCLVRVTDAGTYRLKFISQNISNVNERIEGRDGTHHTAAVTSAIFLRIGDI